MFVLFCLFVSVCLFLLHIHIHIIMYTREKELMQFQVLVQKKMITKAGLA